MLKAVHPKLPMRNKEVSRHFYVDLLEFNELGDIHFADYFMVEKDQIEIHFFKFEDLIPETNYGQIYVRINHIENYYTWIQSKGIVCTPLQLKPWQQMEFSILDPDKNLITFGQAVY